MPDLILKAKLDSTGIKQGVDQAKGHMAQFGKGLSGVAGAAGINTGPFGRLVDIFKNLKLVVGPVGAAIGVAAAAVAMMAVAMGTLIVTSIRWAHALSDAAASAGVTAKQLQEVRNAAIGTSASEEDMAMALNKISQAQSEVIDGNKKTIASFDKLGISEEEAVAANSAEVLKMIAKGYVEAGQSAGAFGAAADLLGAKTFPKLREALVALAQGTDKPMQTMSDRQVARLDMLGARWDAFKKSVGIAMKLVGAGMAEAVFGGGGPKLEAKLLGQERTAELAKQNTMIELQERKRKDARKLAIKEEIKAIEDADRLKKAMDVSISFTPITDAVTKLGGMLGGQANNKAMSTAERQLAVEEKMLEYQKEIAKNTAVDKLKAEAEGLGA